jgi:hypothetical protein
MDICASLEVMQQKPSRVDRAWTRICDEIEDAYPGAVVTHSDAGFRARYLGHEFRADPPEALQSMMNTARPVHASS